ncbi:MAG TPA: type II toxin-antitoxin system VapC family toxin [Streptosporangiaceae bacterium]
MIVDANVLLYAVDTSSPFHKPAKDWLEDSLNEPTRIGLPWASLLAFQRISTHPRASASPLNPSQAWSFVADWLDTDGVWVPVPGERHAEIISDLIVAGDLRGNLVTDAHLAALAIEHGVGICSTDSDFARFPQITWMNPLAL